MIKNIIKRDGTSQPFEANKINGWGEWASRSLGKHVDWSSVVLHTVSICPETCTSKELHERLIKTCLDNDSWSYFLMAGRLYISSIYKDLYEGNIPTVKDLQGRMVESGLMRTLDYSDDEYEQIESVINHKLDLKEPHFSLHQIRKKYALRNKKTGEEFESPQFVYMRMAMDLAEDQPKNRRMNDLLKWYKYFSEKKINAPTPNYINLGTEHKGFASCCIYKSGDTAKSLSIGDHIAYTMTYMSAGIGSYLETRSVKDSVRGGTIDHQGKLPYYRSLSSAVAANMQGGRGGACTTYYSAYDPEVKTIIALKNPMSTEDKKIRGIDYSMQYNSFFAKKVARNEDMFLFNVKNAPDLVYSLFGDSDEFEKIYKKYESDESFKKTYVSAREILVKQQSEWYETGRAYTMNAEEMNRHTPHNDKIYSSNLCLETGLPTKEYSSMMDLYSAEDHGRGEVAMCSLAGTLPANITDNAEYEDVCYYALLMIDKCIHRAHYELPHVGVTAKSRMNAGIGLIGVAHYLAKNHALFSSEKGKRLLHELSEKHAYFCIKASLKLGKELGNAPWMEKTKWPEGWLPIDTYKKSADTIVDSSLVFDWEKLRAEIIENNGIRNSSLINHMPSESSSKASATSNGVYPVRELTLIKTDADNTIYWAAPEGERLGKWYENAYDIQTSDMTDVYSIIQKFSDQSISADYYKKLPAGYTVPTSDMIKDFLYRVKMGVKTTYYFNSNTAKEEECESCTL